MWDALQYFFSSRNHGKDFGQEFVKDFDQYFGKDFGQEFGKDFGKEFGRDPHIIHKSNFKTLFNIYKS